MIKVEEKFYQEDNNYNKDIYGKFEEDIKKYINTYKKEEYDEIIKQDKRTNIVNIFSEMRANVIKWYPFDKNKNILEIGANFGEITEELVKKIDNVTAIEFSKDKVNAISKRLEDTSNLELILTSELKKIKFKKKYNYITLIGSAEYSEKLGFKDISELISWSYNQLTDDGKILLAIDNKLGAKYLAGSTRNDEQVPFANYKTYIDKDYKLYGKIELENKLKENGFENYKFYYPVPNYNLTHLIYTDEYLPKKSKYNIYYREDEEIVFNELTLLDEAIRNEKFDCFTNSYLVEIAKSKKEISDISFVNYSNMRKKQYKIITKITKKEVTKQAYMEKGKDHIKNIENNIKKIKEIGLEIYEEAENELILSKYISYPAMDEYLVSLVRQDKIKEFYKELDNWKRHVLGKIKTTIKKDTIFEKYEINIEEEQKNKLKMLKDGFIDLIFQNAFFDGNKYIIIDQEWYEEALPLEFLMYRSIKQLFFQYSEIERKINKEELYKKYNIEEFIPIFEELEQKWQKEIVDDEVFKFYSEKWNRIISIEDIKFKYNQELGKVYKEKEELQNEVNLLRNNRLYKWTRFLRKKKG